MLLGVAANMAATLALAANTQLMIVADHLPRRAAIEQALAGSGITFEWRSGAVADVLLSGTYSGSVGEVVHSLLDGTSYIVIYGRDGETPSRIMVTGANAGTNPPSVSQLPPEFNAVSQSGDDGIGEIGNIKRRTASRNKILNRMQATSAALRRRLAALPPGSHPIRSQAVRVTAGLAFGQSGNIPQISNAHDLTK